MNKYTVVRTVEEVYEIEAKDIDAAKALLEEDGNPATVDVLEESWSKSKIRY